MRLWTSTCWSNEAQAWQKALSLSISNSVPLISPTKAEEVRSIYACLYGFSGSAKGLAEFNIPVWSPLLQQLQNVVSAALIFLFLLGIRNQFKLA